MIFKDKKLHKEIYGEPSKLIFHSIYPFRRPKYTGLVERVEMLEKERDKLKAIVAELVDYVYSNEILNPEPGEK